MEFNDKIKNRETNLKMQYESLRKDLDIMLTSLIPTQKNLMKTIMWVNMTIMGIIATQHTHLLHKEWLLIPFSFSAFAFLLILWSLKTGRMKMLGHIASEEINNLNNDKYEVIHGLNMLISATEYALKNNAEIISTRGEIIAKATNFTLISMISGLIYLSIIINIIL